MAFDHSLTPFWIALLAGFCFMTFEMLYMWGIFFQELYASRVLLIRRSSAETDLDPLDLCLQRLRHTDLVDPHPLGCRCADPTVRFDHGGLVRHLGHEFGRLWQVRGYCQEINQPLHFCASGSFFRGLLQEEEGIRADTCSVPSWHFDSADTFSYFIPFHFPFSFPHLLNHLTHTLHTHFSFRTDLLYFSLLAADAVCVVCLFSLSIFFLKKGVCPWSPVGFTHIEVSHTVNKKQCNVLVIVECVK